MHEFLFVKILCSLYFAGVGVDHEQLVSLARECFVEKKPVWETDTSLVDPSEGSLDLSISQYTGGILQVSGNRWHFVINKQETGLSTLNS